MKLKWIALLHIFLFSLAAAAYANPIFSPDGQQATLPDSGHVVLVHDQGTTTALFSVWLDVYAAGGETGWVIPVPAEPTVGVADMAVVSELNNLTAPIASTANRALAGDEAEGCSLGGGDAPGNSGPGVEVEGTQLVSRAQIEGLEVSILSTTAGDDLSTWLDHNGFTVPGNLATDIQHYVDNGWFFVAVRLQALQQPEHVTALLQLTYPQDSLLFPSRFLALTPGQVAFFPMTLTVVSSAQAVVQNHERQTLAQLAPEGFRSVDEYRGLLRGLVSDARLSWVVESARRHNRPQFADDSPLWELAQQAGLVGSSRSDALYLTRLTTYASRMGAARSPDLELQLDPDADDVSNVVYIPQGLGVVNLASPGLPGRLPLALLVLFGLCYRARLKCALHRFISTAIYVAIYVGGRTCRGCRVWAQRLS